MRVGGEWVHLEKSDARTAAFLVFGDAWPGGPKLLVCFGMSGMATLMWARLLARRFSHLIFTTEFVMAEIPGRWPQRPPTLAFVDTCEVKILGTAPIATSPEGCGELPGGPPSDAEERTARPPAAPGRDGPERRKRARRRQIRGAA